MGHNANLIKKRSSAGFRIIYFPVRAQDDNYAPHRGSHQFRHALAAHMLRQGASLPEIGQVLRHRSPQTTSIYAKADLDALRTVAMAWPGSAQ